MIYTGYWAKIKEYEANGLTPVGISGWSPDGYTGKTYKKLAPKYAWWKEWHDKHLSEQWYINKYKETVLQPLNPIVVAQDLQKMGIEPSKKYGECFDYVLKEKLKNPNIIHQDEINLAKTFMNLA